MKLRALGQGGQDAVAVGGGIVAGDDGRHQVGHDDRAGEMARGFGQDGAQHRAVAQMQVPVVGAADRQGLGHRCLAYTIGPPRATVKTGFAK